MNLGLHYQRFPIVLEGYIDADWNTLSDDSKATSGYIFSIFLRSCILEIKEINYLGSVHDGV